MWRNVSKWDPSKEPQTITSFFFSFLAGGFFNGFFAGKNKNYTRKAPFFFSPGFMHIFKYKGNMPLNFKKIV
jgi:hypothetical protein